MICCITYFPMMWMLGREIRSRIGYAAMVSGFVMLGSGLAVGWFPLDVLKAHLMAALVFFWSFLVTALLFLLAFLPRWNQRPSRWMVAVGCLATFCLLSFLIYPKESVVQFILEPEHVERPPIWGVAILEWSVLFSLYSWGLTAVFVLWRCRGRETLFQTRESN